MNNFHPSEWINGLAFTLAYGFGFPAWLAYLSVILLLLLPMILLIRYLKTKY